MLTDLLRKLNNEFPDSSILFRAIKSASVSCGVLNLEVASQAMQERIQFGMKLDVLKVARELDDSITGIQINSPKARS